jgi:hypothetical protein
MLLFQKQNIYRNFILCTVILIMTRYQLLISL